MIMPTGKYYWWQGFKQYYRPDKKLIFIYEMLPNYNGKRLVDFINYEKTLTTNYFENINVSETFLNNVKQAAKSEIICSDLFRCIESKEELVTKGNIIFTKKATAKYISNTLASFLTTCTNSNLYKSYTITSECCNVLVQTGKQLTGCYCKQRWCTICNRIRTAKMINTYSEHLDNFTNPYFLTLTIENVNDEVFTEKNILKKTLKKMQQLWSKILTDLNRIKKQKKRFEPYILQGVKKLECTYNFEEHTYHPHYHFITENENIAFDILQRWLFWSKNFKFNVNHKGQDVRPLEGKKGYLELFKYFTKIVSKTNEIEVIELSNNNFKSKKKEAIVIPALDTIFNAMSGKRVYDSFGIDVKNTENDFDLFSVEVENLMYQNVNWSWKNDNWYNDYTGTPLAGIIDTDKINKLFTNVFN